MENGEDAVIATVSQTGPGVVMCLRVQDMMRIVLAQQTIETADTTITSGGITVATEIHIGPRDHTERLDIEAVVSKIPSTGNLTENVIGLGPGPETEEEAGALRVTEEIAGKEINYSPGVLFYI